ncbi:MAG TPA: sugar isomerase domain-containing protein [Spirochaetes bacterium]|nr:sugar isomerase domain-containing protein [Spirochaetota bacterium]
MDFFEKYPAQGISYIDICKEFLDEIESRQKENFKKAGLMIGDRIMEDEVIFAVGCGGHSYIPPMDMFCRAGSLVPINATLDASTTTITGGFRGVFLERVPGYMKALLQYFRLKKDDVVIIFNNVGVNAMTIDAAEECKRLGAKTIGVAGSPWQDKTPADHPSRHPSGKNLKDMVDIYIDDYNPVGDAVLNIEGLDVPLAPISSITDGYIVRRIEIEAVKHMISKGFDPPVWVSANVQGGDAINEEYIKKYYNKVKLM